MSWASWIGACALPGALSFTASAAFVKNLHGTPDSYYALLKKPSYAPPGWVFAPAWTVLYGCMGHASYLVWKTPRNVKMPLLLYGAHLALNCSYMPISVGLKKHKLNFYLISAVTSAAATCGVIFYKVNRKAGYFFIPYVAWLCFATKLTYDIWKLNDEKIITDKK